MTATKTEPTDEQLKAYADQLPEIYREVLVAFPAESPMRRPGDGLSVATIESRLLEVMPDDFRSADLELALDRLKERRFIVPDPYDLGYTFYRPTPLGERLITAVTGHRPRVVEVPPLPEPTWG